MKKPKINYPVFFLGFDQAIVNSGIAVLSWDGKKDTPDYVHSELFSSTFKWGAKSDLFILLEQGQYLKKILNEYAVKNIGGISIEGVSFGSPGGASSRGSIWGLFVTTCVGYSDVVVVPPLSLKMFITGKGTADKNAIKNIMIPKYGLDKLNRKIWDDECDALGLCEIAFWSWRIQHEGLDKIKKKLQPHELKVLWNEETNSEGLPKGLINRVDEFFLRKIG